MKFLKVAEKQVKTSQEVSWQDQPIKVRVNYSTKQGMTPEPDPSFEETFQNLEAAILEAKKRANWDCDLAVLLNAGNKYSVIDTLGFY